MKNIAFIGAISANNNMASSTLEQLKMARKEYIELYDLTLSDIEQEFDWEKPSDIYQLLSLLSDLYKMCLRRDMDRFGITHYYFGSRYGFRANENFGEFYDLFIQQQIRVDAGVGESREECALQCLKANGIYSKNISYFALKNVLGLSYEWGLSVSDVILLIEIINPRIGYAIFDGKTGVVYSPPCPKQGEKSEMIYLMLDFQHWVYFDSQLIDSVTDNLGIVSAIGKVAAIMKYYFGCAPKFVVDFMTNASKQNH